MGWWMHTVAAPSHYLILTGLNIPDIKVEKEAYLWPGQSCRDLDISPVSYTFDVQTMSVERLPLTLSLEFIIGPRDEMDSLKRFAKRERSASHLTILIKGIVEREARLLAAGLPMEHMLGGTREFLKELSDKVQLGLDQYELHIYNVNIAQVVDLKGKKAQEEAANQAKVDVGEAEEIIAAPEADGFLHHEWKKANTLAYSKQEVLVEGARPMGELYAEEPFHIGIVNNRASTFILGEKSLSLDSVHLGRLVVNIADPQECYYDSPAAAGLTPIVTEHKDCQGIDDSDKGSSVFSKFTRLVSLGHSKRHGSVSHVDTKCVKHYRFGNSTQYFRDIIQHTETRKWIETALKEGGQICLLVGYVTFLDAVVTEYETRFKSLDLSLSVPTPEDVHCAITGGSANGSGAIKSKYIAREEQVFALQYRKVNISMHNSKDAVLSRSRWEVLTKHRQAQNTKTDDIVEADISESEERDNFEFDDDEDEDDEGWTKLADEEGDFYL